MPHRRYYPASLAIGLLALSAGLSPVAGTARAALPPVGNEPWPGTLRLEVDVTDTAHALIRVHETIPVQPGPLTLLYPQWLPGNHAPRGPIDELAGLEATAGGKPLAWTRDPVDVYALHFDVPRGTSAMDLDFQVATPVATAVGRVVFTPSLLNLQWNMAVLYPAGHAASQIPVSASVRLPAGWKQASALPVKSTAKAVEFGTVSLETLVDSPLYAGQYSSVIELAPGAEVPVRLDLFAEAPGDLVATPEQLAPHRALVREAYAALGQPHYDHYDFLVAASEQLGGIGLEHMRSTEIQEPAGYLSAWGDNVLRRATLPHEFTHAWNGKYRRPEDLWTPNYNVPMQDSLLWVYEGMTQYYGIVLAARSGLWTAELAREQLADYVATYSARRPGRSWRPLADTTNQPILNPRRPMSWTSWQRTEDYYTESAVLWLGVDGRLRQLTGGARSLDDFARAFLGAAPNHGTISGYRFEDVVAALDAVAHDDWKSFLEARVLAVQAPLDGAALAGLKLVYDDKPNQEIRDGERERKTVELGYSLGLVVGREGALTDVVWDGPAFKAGLTTGTTLVAVNGRAYSAELLKDAITQAKSGSEPIELLVRSQDRFRTVQIDYHGGLRYPHLVPLEGQADRLAEILKPRAALPATGTGTGTGAGSGSGAGVSSAAAGRPR